MKIETLEVGPFQVNCCILWGDAAEAIVVDPGEDADGIHALLEKRKLGVAGYMLTHGHMDHVSALASLHARRPAPVAIAAEDLAWCYTAVNQMPPFYAVPVRPGQTELILCDGLRGRFGGLDWTILATPGHTEGSVCILFEEQGVLLSGDTLFAGSAGRTDLPGGNGDTLMRSLRRLADLPADLTVYPGHGPATTIGRELNHNPFLREAALLPPPRTV